MDGVHSANGLNATNVPDEMIRQSQEPVYQINPDKDANSHRQTPVALQHQQDQAMTETPDSEDDEEFYTPGSQELLDARIDILKYSLKAAAARHQKQVDQYQTQSTEKTLKFRRGIGQKLAQYDLYGTQLISGNTRALSSIRFSSNGSEMAVGSWNGSVYILDVQTLSTARTYSGYHTEKVCLDWYQDLLVSGGNEGTLNLWNTATTSHPKPTVSIKNAHEHRIAKTLIHPNGSYVATTSFDQTWKLWDPEKSKSSLLQQEGHSKEVFAGAFHPDGSLFTSGGLDGIVHVWDLRSGKSIAVFDKHISGVYSISWSPNGYEFASASGDCSVKIWDLRNSRNGELFSIPAHSKLVSEVRFFQGNANNTLGKDLEGNTPGTFLSTSSYDGTVCIWSADNWVKVKILKGHTDKVMACDISPDGTNIASTGWDRTVKLWSTNN